MSVQQAIQWQISVKAMSPGAIDMVKIIALTAMLVDHLNILFLHPPYRNCTHWVGWCFQCLSSSGR